MKLNFKKPDFKIKKTTFQKIGKIILWTLVVFLLLRGIGSVFKPDTATKAQNMINEFKKNEERKEELNFKVSSFAQNFVMEYLTYDSLSNEDYNKRIKDYIPSYLNSLGMNISGHSKALYASAINIDWVSDDQVNVDILANVKYKINELGENQESIQREIEEDTYIRVPVGMKDKSFVVEDYPIFISKPSKAALSYKNISGKRMDTEESKNVSQMLENFYRAYYEGNIGEIDYYILDSNKKVAGLNGRYKFERLDSTVVLINENEENNYLALVELSVSDINNQSIKQRFNLDIVKKDGRYYIKDFDTRIGNLDKIKDLGNEEN